jgi:hypothetical protein
MQIAEIVRHARHGNYRILHKMGFDDYRFEMDFEDSHVQEHHITVTAQRKNIKGLDFSQLDYDTENTWYTIIIDRVKVLIHD